MDTSFLPVDVWLSCFEEGVSKQIFVIADICNKEVVLGGSAVIIDFDFYGFFDSASFIERSVDILDLSGF